LRLRRTVVHRGLPDASPALVLAHRHPLPTAVSPDIHGPAARPSFPGSPRSACSQPSAVTPDTILRSQAEAILASDFFTADLLDGTQAYVLAVIEHATRRIRILGVTLHPTGEWTVQQARNLIMDLGEQAHRVKFMIRDRGSNYTAAFDAVLAGAGIRTVLCNVQTPRMNAIAERWIGGCRRELLDRTLIWNLNHLRRILREYEIHHNQHRPHRSLHSAAPLKPLPQPVILGQYRVRKQTRTGGMINEYRLVA
jgi:putative transposase